MTTSNPRDYGLLPDGTPDLGDSETGPWVPAPDVPEPAAGTSVREAASETEEPAKKLPGKRARVVLAGPDGEPLEPVEIRIDNRDYIRWDKTAARQGWVKKKDDAVPVYVMATFLSWSAMTRQGLTSLTWGQFEAACIEAEHVEEEADTAHPTR